jgi:thioredoxin reductase (NADPH)
MTGPTPSPRKPVILTVDDDPAVSRAVARDLRRHYGERYRIVRAESGPDALETLNELKLRGDTVAVFVADYRMPQMSGIEFLEEAMDVYPLARRVLLTAYADTHAAIDAINVVDLDHYLLKPWDPPEEKLYPVVDGLLEAWHATGDRAIPHTKVIGHRWNERSWEVRQFLARNQHSFRSFTADEPKGKQLLDAAGLDGFQLPVVITEQGETLVEPTDAELAAMLGLSTSPSLEMYELAVIGGGPAGLAAAVYGASEGLKTVLIEETTTGGQAGRSSRIENYLGFPTGISGQDLTARAYTQAQKFGAGVLIAKEARRLLCDRKPYAIEMDDGQRVPARTIVIATGAEYRKPSLPGLERFEGAGVYYGATFMEAQLCTGEEVIVVGGGNSAGQAAVFLAQTARHVHILVRSKGLAESMSRYLIRRIEDNPAITLHTYTELTAAEGQNHLERVTWRDQSAGTTETHNIRHVFVMTGAMPSTSWLKGCLVLDEKGFIKTGPDLSSDELNAARWPLPRRPYLLETSLPGVFAVGDVRGGSVKRVASAVGEGSISVSFVHRALQE